MERGFYLATFDLEEDYTKALTGGPWMVSGAYLTVQPWSLDFNPISPISKVVPWIRIPGLSFRYYHKSTLRAIGMLLGEKPLVPWIKVDGRTYGVEYEGLPLICYECGNYGHVKQSCKGKDQLAAGTAPQEQSLSSQAPESAHPDRNEISSAKEEAALNDSKTCGALKPLPQGPKYSKSGPAQPTKVYRPKEKNELIPLPTAQNTMKSDTHLSRSLTTVPTSKSDIVGEGVPSAETTKPRGEEKEARLVTVLKPGFIAVEQESSLDRSKHVVVALQSDRLALEDISEQNSSILPDSDGDMRCPNEVRSGILRRIRQLLLQDWQVTMSHVYREGNRCAGFLATHALSLGTGLHILTAPPMGLQVFLREDTDEVAWARRCS
ncbi:hypothetical protein K1719_038158 [Acacia pycnantha]|nr:hypothetical protein K1719_038158 [Acacia pycnantha]